MEAVMQPDQSRATGAIHRVAKAFRAFGAHGGKTGQGFCGCAGQDGKRQCRRVGRKDRLGIGRTGCCALQTVVDLLVAQLVIELPYTACVLPPQAVDAALLHRANESDSMCLHQREE